MEYRTKYKCRLCCEEFYGPASTTDLDTAVTAMVHLVVGIRGVHPLAPPLTKAHECGGDHKGSLGLADFQGWEAVP